MTLITSLALAQAEDLARVLFIEDGGISLRGVIPQSIKKNTQHIKAVPFVMSGLFLATLNHG
jgi:hypothetical protein